jgi:kinesin family protein 5
LSTLRFGVRAKAIKNKPKINKEHTVEELKMILQDKEKEILIL